MIDNFALFVVHAALLLLIFRLLRTPDPDETPPPRRAPGLAPPGRQG